MENSQQRLEECTFPRSDTCTVSESWTVTHLKDDVSQQPQVSVSHGPRTNQNLRVVAVMPLIVDGHDDPAETKHRYRINFHV